MAKRKVNYNTAVNRIKKAVHEYCIDFYLTEQQTQGLLDVVESQRRQSLQAGIPPPPKDPPGGTNP